MIDSGLKAYFYFAVHALRGGNPVATDKFLKDHFDTILTVADALFDEIDQKPIYRGLILNRPQKYLKPHPNFTYISCSEDRSVAEHFADPTPQGFGSFGYLGDYGYVVEIKPPYRTLFHHSLFNHPDVGSIFKRLFKLPTHDLEEQKEVMILQPPVQIRLSDKPFKVYKRKG